MDNDDMPFTLEEIKEMARQLKEFLPRHKAVQLAESFNEVSDKLLLAQKEGKTVH